jgi:hypothetical protein
LIRKGKWVKGSPAGFASPIWRVGYGRAPTNRNGHRG